MSDSKKNITFYSLSQVLQSISSVITGAYKTPYWIKAEMIKLNHYPKSGHCYPDLVEKSDGKIKAQMRATMWSGNYETVNKKFLQTTGKALANDMNILFLAQVKFDPVYGFSLNILDIDADYELGILAKAKKDCIDRLKKEGSYDFNRNLPFPTLPKRIAVISDETSKGYKDFLSIINNNTRGYKYFHMLFPSLLQGDKAVDTMVKQLQNIKKVAHHFDLVAIIRGGGGDAGMDCYNHYKLASEVANFPIPVISGIGHSTNETVVEMVAHHNPITPTDLAYMLQQKFDNITVEISGYQGVIEGFVSDYINNKISSLNSHYTYVLNKSNELINSQKSLLKQLNQNITHLSKAIISENKNKINELRNKNKYTIQKRLSIEEFELENHTKTIKSIMKNVVAVQIQKLNFIAEKIELVKPENLLKKGYSYNTIDGKIITKLKDIKVGDTLITKAFEGEIESEITKINRYDK